MKKWWEWLWECLVVVACCAAVITMGVLIGSYWEMMDQLEAVATRLDTIEKVTDELTVQSALVNGRLTAIELNMWRY